MPRLCVEFIVEYLNHTSKVKLQNKTPEEVMNSNTHDISVFRFEFWQPIEYLYPNVNFPGCKWKPGSFIEIAWKHGDPFTYKVWTELEGGGCKKGQELIRNFVRVRQVKDKFKVVSEEYEDFLN